ncbi:MAG: hypothetical protein QW112_02935 [Candidatus Micrarchaeia archaeon]
MFRDKKSIENIFSSPRTWRRVGNGIFTQYAKDLKPEDRMEVIGERCRIILNSFIEPNKLRILEANPGLSKLVEYITSKNLADASENAKRCAHEFFAHGGTPSEAEEFIKGVENQLFLTALELYEWEPSEPSRETKMSDIEGAKLDLLAHEVRSTITTIGSRITLLLNYIREIHSDIHKEAKQQ